MFASLAIGTAAAHASSASVSGTTVFYVAAAGESNVLTFATIGQDVVIDDSVNLAPGAGCVQGGEASPTMASQAKLTTWVPTSNT